MPPLKYLKQINNQIGEKAEEPEANYTQLDFTCETSYTQILWVHADVTFSVDLHRCLGRLNQVKK